MIKLYTPDQWHKLLNYPIIIIEDDGFIYSEQDYYKTFRQPIGKIDYSNGYIYGSDYHKWPCYPIGQIREENGITRIYGDDYHKLMARPLYHIRDGRAYTDDEYFKTFPNPTFYVEQDLVTSRSDSSASMGSSDTYRKRPKDDEAAKTRSSMIRTLIVFIVIVVISFLAWKALYIDDGDFKDYFIANIICACVGAVFSYFREESDIIVAAMFNVFILSTPLFWCYIMIGVIKDIGICWGTLGAAFSGVLVAVLLCLASSIVLGFLVAIIKKLKS